MAETESAKSAANVRMNGPDGLSRNPVMAETGAAAQCADRARENREWVPGKSLIRREFAPPVPH